MLRNNFFESSVSFFIWRMRDFGGVPGHVSMRLERPNLVTELPNRGLYEAGKLVADGMRSARISNVKYLDMATNDDDAYKTAMAASNQLYLSFWPGGKMPRSYIEDMVRETGEKTQIGLQNTRDTEYDISAYEDQIRDLEKKLVTQLI